MPDDDVSIDDSTSTPRAIKVFKDSANSEHQKLVLEYLAGGPTDSDPTNVTNGTRLPTAPYSLFQILGMADATLDDGSAVVLPGLGGLDSPNGVTCVVSVETGTLRWGLHSMADPTTSAGASRDAGQALVLPIGAQLSDVRVVGPALIHVMYYTIGELS